MLTHSDSIGSILLDFLLDEVYKNSEINKPDIDLDHISIADEYFDYVYDNGYLDAEVIYYSNAIEYLSRNDPSLQESLAIAEELGYTPKDLNSEKLASMLKSGHQRDAFEELRSKIEECFEQVQNNLPFVSVTIQEEGQPIVHHFISLESGTVFQQSEEKPCTEDMPPEVWVNNDVQVVFESHSENDQRHTFVFDYNNETYLVQIINNEITWSKDER